MIKIDLINKSDKASPEISACYFYSSKGWSLIQDGQDCPSKDADVPGYTKRHFLRPPVNKLHKEQWAQLRFHAKKTMATAWKGEELKDSYKVSGRSVLRIVTTEGNFDYELSIDTSANSFPF
jgi:hypothetical protein